MSRLHGVRAAYDTLATEYAKRIAGELEGKPLDRALLDEFARIVGPDGRVCDAGCGPGHVTRYLRERGVDVYGIDLAPAMVAEARRLNPDIEFLTGDFNDLPAEPGGLAAVVAFYSLIHLGRDDVPAALRNLGTRLRPDGLLFVAFHIGTGELHLDEWWGRAVPIDFTFFETAEMRRYLEEAGYRIEWMIEREPYPDVEHPTRRGYLLGRLL